MGEDVYVHEHRGYRQKFCSGCVLRRVSKPCEADRLTSGESESDRLTSVESEADLIHEVDLFEE